MIDGDAAVRILEAPLRGRVRLAVIASAMLVVAIVALVAFEPKIVGWAAVALVGSFWFVAMAELVRGGRIEISLQDFTKVSPFGRTAYRFIECSAFVTYVNPLGRGRAAVAFNSTQAGGPIARANQRTAGWNTYINAAFGLSAGDMADLLNHSRDRALASR